MNWGRWLLTVAMVGWMASATGCIERDKYIQLERQNRAQAGNIKELETELYDCRTNKESLQARLTATESQLGDKDRLIENLQSENDQIAKAFDMCQQAVERLANQAVPGIGALPQELDAALQAFSRQYADSVTYDAGRGIVKWKSDLIFAFGSDIVMDSRKQSLGAFAKIMTSPAASGFDTLVIGHTDDRPLSAASAKKHATNWHLSAHRAIAVAKVLMAAGITAPKIGIAGFAEYRPVVPGKSRPGVGEPRNRRVEIYVVPAGSIGGVAAKTAPANTSTELVDPPAVTDQVK